jgi:16S rRNA (guanine527-N7)-methyltransferase
MAPWELLRHANEYRSKIRQVRNTGISIIRSAKQGFAEIMHPNRIVELLDPFLGDPDGKAGPERWLTCDDISHISTYIDLLKRWNSRVNLTAIRDEDEIITRHFGESLFAARHLFPGRANFEKNAGTIPRKSSLADLGSGAGFPGIPVKLWAPEISLTLIESNHKKAAFLREVCRALTLMDVDVQNTRAEVLSRTFDVVILRAVERFNDILPIACRLLAPSSRLALLISKSQLKAGLPELAAMTSQQLLAIPNSDSRILLIGTRVP